MNLLDLTESMTCVYIERPSTRDSAFDADVAMGR